MARRKRRSSRGSGPPSRGAVYPTLDLHGLTADEAVRSTERWLRDRRVDRESTVLVITGRGRHSSGPAVLPDEIRDLLDRLSGVVVQEYSLDRGGGAYLVRLIRSPSPPASLRSRSTLKGTDPELLRLAEERLLELGVSPTPALLAAELSRLIEQGLQESD